MPGIYCARCQTKTIPEQDGVSCSNCGQPLVRPLEPKPASRNAAGGANKPARGPATPPTAA